MSGTGPAREGNFKHFLPSAPSCLKSHDDRTRPIQTHVEGSWPGRDVEAWPWDSARDVFRTWAESSPGEECMPPSTHTCTRRKAQGDPPASGPESQGDGFFLLLPQHEGTCPQRSRKKYLAIFGSTKTQFLHFQGVPELTAGRVAAVGAE